MFWLILRILGFLFIAVAVIAGGSDIAASVDAGRLVSTPLGMTWFALHSDSINLTQAIIQRYIHPAIWDPAILWLLLRPTWAVSLGLGVILLGFGLWLRPRPAAAKEET